MSTCWGYRCNNHTPPLDSETWINHGEAVLADAFTRFRSGTWPTDSDGDPVEVMYPPHPDSTPYGITAPIYWLREHPNCDIALINEYGDEEPITVSWDRIYELRAKVNRLTREVRRLGGTP